MILMALVYVREIGMMKAFLKLGMKMMDKS
jgi:hypothetical protein